MTRCFAAAAGCASILLLCSAADAGGAISEQTAWRIALDRSGAAAGDVQRRKVRRDEEDGEAVLEFEFETACGDYDYSVSLRDGMVLHADAEVREECCRRWEPRSLGAAESRRRVIGEVLRRVPGARASDISLRQEGSRWEGVLRQPGFKHEFEADRRSGIITDWTTDRRQDGLRPGRRG